ncbi:hypothetical protein [Mangrovibacterium lignilyticum]|uniref:hypothetical protein n=1 Tax=Mangrovibacterium lignilyticum TaxID=2668052 RepID=UPI0013D7EE73|nr:hypothetical protein [Mangrovibacterium lignilyticum]
METKEIIAVKESCKGNRKSLFEIAPWGIDFDLPIGRFLGVFEIALLQNGFTKLNEYSNERRKVYLNGNQIFQLSRNETGVTEVVRIYAYNGYDEQLMDFMNILNQLVETYGAPHEWLEIDDNITAACSWDARNGNCLSVGFNCSSNEIVLKYLKNQYQ